MVPLELESVKLVVPMVPVVLIIGSTGNIGAIYESNALIVTMYADGDWCH